VVSLVVSREVRRALSLSVSVRMKAKPMRTPIPNFSAHFL
jgi:hypothetical protein